MYIEGSCVSFKFQIDMTYREVFLSNFRKFSIYKFINSYQREKPTVFFFFKRITL